MTTRGCQSDAAGMTVVDASAILAIILGEEDAAVFEEALAAAGGALMSPVNFWEVLVRSRSDFGQAGVDAAEALMAGADIVVAPVEAQTAREAAEAFARYRGRPGGRLNMGDCFAYALAKSLAAPLLYVGDDFTFTDLEAALPFGDRGGAPPTT